MDGAVAGAVHLIDLTALSPGDRAMVEDLVERLRRAKS